MQESRFDKIAKAVGTPFYCYDAEIIRAKAQQIKSLLSNFAVCYYSLKANPNPSLVKILIEEGFGCEVCSLLELETALMAGADPHDIIFLGPGKSDDELHRCIEFNIYAVVVESLSELKQLELISNSIKKPVSVALRINLESVSRGAKLQMAGRVSQFGFDESDVPAALGVIAQSNYINLIGIHAYSGTRFLRWPAVVENTQRVLAMACRVHSQNGRPLQFIDVGGGFGVNYFDDERPLDLSALSTGLQPLLLAQKQVFPDTKIIFELGRFLVAEAGIFVTQVRYIKTSRGKLFAICDGGANCHAAAAGFGSTFQRNFPIRRLTGILQGESVYTLSGPLCTPADIIGSDVLLPTLREGDLIAILLSGAYGLTASPVHFLGFDIPNEILIDKEHTFLIRQRESRERFMVRQTFHKLEMGDFEL